MAPPARRSAVFEASHPFAFLDYFRVPYEVRGPADADAPHRIGRLRPTDTSVGRTLLWRRADGSRRPSPTNRAGQYQLRGFTLVGHVDRADPRALLGSVGRDWRPMEPIVDRRGRQVAAVWADVDGSVYLPFDPGEVMRYLWSEGYTAIGHAAVTRRVRRLIIRCYYLVRPLLPRPTQLRLRRAFARRQGAPSFPRWPVEHSLHDLYEWLLGVLTTVAGEPVPYVDLWPGGKSWAFVLTHDVETGTGLRDMALLRDAERRHGYSSSWNLVAERYPVDDATVRSLQDDGCEVGVHGLRHDGRDLASRRVLRQRLPAMRANAARWDAVGFRSPATQRSWKLMPSLGFDYDTSYTDTDPYEPQPGGCCTYLPFFNEQLVELPITLPQDHTLFEILEHTDGKLWIGKARDIRDRGGMVLVLAHPDYARDVRLDEAWRGLLDEFAGDETVWQALPRDVASWWRRRASSSLSRDGDAWRIRGPAADDGRVRLTVPSSADVVTEA
jgi:hypothetical protein